MENLTQQPSHKLDLIIGKLLRIGVITASVITVLGGLVYLYQHHGTVPDYANFNGGAELYLREFNTIIPALLRFDGAAIIQFGVMVLVATPILRVVFSLVGFLIEKDRLYVVITTIVLLIILANMIFGWH